MLDKDWYSVPSADGRMELRSRQEIVNHITSAKRPITSTTKYFLHTRKFPQGVSIVVDDGDRLFRAGFNASHPVRITIHGWLGGQTSDVNAVQEYLKLGEFNHIVVDWSVDANTIHYPAARNQMPVIAKEVVQLVNFLVKMGSSYAKIYAIGHSLGAHMAALVGKYLKQGEIEACICLDPPSFLFSPEDDQVTRDACKYVEVMHTSKLGIASAIGDSDYYPNGGSSQPGCGLNLAHKCAHSRGPKLFKEALATGRGFMGQTCNGSLDDVEAGNCIPTGMGSRALSEPVDTSAKGMYYFKTAKSKPYMLP